MAEPKLLGISGSLRAQSINTKLVHECARVFGPAEFVLANLRLPLYDGDLEAAEGVPGEVETLYEQMIGADAIVISTPEYNGGIPGVLKNAFDWISRKKPPAMQGKPLAIVSAAAGRSGGARAQYALRTALTAFRPRIALGPEVMIAGGARAFDETGQLADPSSVEFLTTLMDALKAEMT